MGREGGVFLNSEPNERGSQPSASAPIPAGLALAGFIGLTLLVALSASAVTATSVHTWYLSLRRPPGTPPNWLFGPVWTALYLQLALSAWLIWRRVGGGPALRLWGWQLLANALWTPAFFGLRAPAAAVLVILAVAVLLAATMRAFAAISRLAAWLLLPYAAWTGYAAYLTIGFWWLNRA